MILWSNFNTLNRLPLIFLNYIDHNFRKHSELAIPKPFFMTICVSFYKAAGNLDIYSMFHRISSLYISTIWQWLDLFQTRYLLCYHTGKYWQSLKSHILYKSFQQNSDQSLVVTYFTKKLFNCGSCHTHAFVIISVVSI